MSGPIIFSIMTMCFIGQGHFLDLFIASNTSLASQQSTTAPLHHGNTIRRPALDQGNLVSISEVLLHPKDYHQTVIRLRGTVTRLELHLDETHHFIDFVFFLADGEQRLLVFGRHDRTKGDIQLTSDRTIEVQGRFWQERFANEHRFENNLEAQDIHFYPPLISDQAKVNHPTRSSSRTLEVGS